MVEPADVPAPPPDRRDWTFVIRSGCQDCGYTPQDVTDVGDRLRATVPAWRAALSRPDANLRPAPTVWSPVEYACHVRNVCSIYRRRLNLMLEQDDPLFADWDQDAAAVSDAYYLQPPGAVAEQLSAEAGATADAFDRVVSEQWDRPGKRSNGSLFTVRTLAVYFLHDVEHHLHDVARS